MILMCEHYPLSAQDYITQTQLEQATITDLPGRLGSDFYRERDPENMAANAISKVSNLLSNYTGITLGAVGGLATLGFLGVISAPIAVLGAALVGGLALVGVNSDRGVPAGLSQPNYGHFGNGPSPVYGVQSNQTGITGGMFGWSNPSRDGQYNIGSLGIGSAMRAPVRVNMQSPHVTNTMGRGFNFDHYDSGYQNMPIDPMTGQLGMATSPVAGTARMPYAPSSQPSPSAGLQGAPNAPIGYGYPPNSGMSSAWNVGHVNPAGAYSQTHYDRRSGNTFNNFFSRTDGAGILSGERGTRADRTGYRNPWAGPSPYSYNWQQTRNAPGTYLSQSWEYQQAGQWKAQSPQGKVYGGWLPNPGQAPTPINQSATNTPNYLTQSSGSGLMPDNPMDFRFGQPIQQYEMGLNYNYPMGNAYSNPAVPDNYRANFMIPNQPVNYGYQPNFPQVDGSLQYGLGTQYQGGMQVLPYQSGSTPPQIRPAWAGQPPIVNGMQVPAEVVRPKVPAVNLTANPAIAQQISEAREAASQAVMSNEFEVMGAALSPQSSALDFKRLTELEEQRQLVYQRLLGAVKSGNEEQQKKLFDEYQNLGAEITELRNR